MINICLYGVDLVSLLCGQRREPQKLGSDSQVPTVQGKRTYGINAFDFNMVYISSSSTSFLKNDVCGSRPDQAGLRKFKALAKSKVVRSIFSLKNN
jgi:hypothetical protein